MWSGLLLLAFRDSPPSLPSWLDLCLMDMSLIALTAIASKIRFRYWCWEISSGLDLGRELPQWLGETKTWKASDMVGNLQLGISLCSVWFLFWGRGWGISFIGRIRWSSFIWIEGLSAGIMAVGYLNSNVRGVGRGIGDVFYIKWKSKERGKESKNQK